MYKFMINGEAWKAFCFEDDEFEKRFGPGCAGLCDSTRRQLFIAEGELTRETVIHELCHAYYSYLCLNSTDLTNAQMEEVFCEMFAKHGPTILKQAKNILNRLKDLA